MALHLSIWNLYSPEYTHKLQFDVNIGHTNYNASTTQRGKTVYYI